MLDPTLVSLKRNHSVILESKSPSNIKSFYNILSFHYVERRSVIDKDINDDGKGDAKVVYVKKVHYVNQKYNFDNYIERSDIYKRPNVTDILTYVEPVSMNEK